MSTDMKFSIKEAFKSAFKIFGQNFFVIFAFMVFCTILVSILIVFILATIGIPDESTDLLRALAELSTPKQLLIQCVRFFSLNFVSFLLVSAFLPTFRGSKIKFRNYFPNFKKVFKALLATILLAAVPLGISFCEFFIFNSNSFADFLAKNESLFDMVASILRGMLVFFYIEIVSGESVLQSIRNILEPLSKSKIIPFFILLVFIDFVVGVIPVFIPLIAKSNTLLGLTLGIKQFLVILPFSTLALIGAYTQLSSSKSNT